MELGEIIFGFPARISHTVISARRIRNLVSDFFLHRLDHGLNLAKEYEAAEQAAEHALERAQRMANSPSSSRICRFN